MFIDIYLKERNIEMNDSKRRFLKSSIGIVGGLVTVNALSAEWVQSICTSITPKQPEGPFYPINEQLDSDNDLTILEGSTKRAKGQIVYTKGIVQDQYCNPVQDALVEIWQACASGKYNHPNDPNEAELDPDFQYYGKSVTNEKGEYLFKTILPGSYPAAEDWIRPSHIHFKVHKRNYTELTTQMYFEGLQYNAEDLILNALNEDEKKSVIVKLEPPTIDLEPQAQLCRFDLSIVKIKK